MRLPARLSRLRARRRAPRHRRARSSAALVSQGSGLHGLSLLAREGRLMFTAAQENRWFTGRDQTARLPDHDQHHREAEQEHTVLGRFKIAAEPRLEKIELAH